MSARRVIVLTGATGTTGSQVARALKFHHDANLTVRMVVRSAARHRDLATYGEVVEGDLADEASLATALRGAHGLFLLTPFAPSAPQLAQNAIRAAQAAKVDFLLRMSSLGASKGARVPVAKDHGVIDEAVKASGLPYAILQPSFFMQNLLTYNGRSLRESGVFYGASGGVGAYGAIHAGDTGEVAATILADPERHVNKSYLLTGPEAITDEQIARLATKVWGGATGEGREIRYQDLPMDKFKQKLIEQGVSVSGRDARGWMPTTMLRGCVVAVSVIQPSFIHSRVFPLPVRSLFSNPRSTCRRLLLLSSPPPPRLLLLQEFQASNASLFEQAKKSGHAKGVSPAVEQILGRRGRTFEEYLEEVKKAKLV